VTSLGASVRERICGRSGSGRGSSLIRC
jgi:hypothetical protein